MSFFTFGDNTQITRKSKASVATTVSGCDACGRKDVMQVQGKGVRKILLVLEYPSEDILHSSDGAYIAKLLEQHGVDILRDCYVTAAVQCARGGKITPKHIQHCAPKLSALIHELKPSLIVPFGILAVQALIFPRLKGRIVGTKPSAYFGECIPDREYNAWICPTYAPSHVQGREDGSVARLNWEIATAMQHIGKALPQIPDDVRTTDNVAEAIEWITTARRKAEWLAFDYETTGIKPHAAGHKIVTASFAYDGVGFAFPFFDNAEFRAAWKKLLTSDVHLIAHKADFEIMWTYERAGGYFPSVTWDTCIASHIIQNTQSTGLKFQVYTKLGILGFDTAVEMFLTKKKDGEDSKSGNAKVRTEEAPLQTLVTYNAYDSLYTLLLFERQSALLKHRKANAFFTQGVNALARVQCAGMHIDMKAFRKVHLDLSAQISVLEKQIHDTIEYQQWVQEKGTPLNIDSDVQLKALLYTMRGHTGDSTDEKALMTIGTHFCVLLCERRKLKKLRDTYLSQFEREQVEGIIRAFFNLHLVKTFRSSSNSPNFQNLPKRGKDAKLIRSIIRPTEGNRIIEYDYKGVEVSIGACVHKDPQMIQYIMDATTDMHRDTAADMFMRTPEDVSKQERQIAKNTMVFPAFYGSGVRQIAPNAWDAMPEETRKHLKAQGIRNLAQFEKHINVIFNRFWNERFEVYGAWRRKTAKQANRNGYVDLLTGFRCYAPLSYTECTNYPIQGTAFHALLWTLMQVEEPIRALSGRSRIIGQIHDALIVDAHPDDEEAIDALIKEYGTERIRKVWAWIIVPLQIEKERSDVNGTWAEMEACGFI